MIARLQRCLFALALSTGLLVVDPACAEPQSPPSEIVQQVSATLRAAGVPPRKIARARGLYRPVNLTGQAAADWLVDTRATPKGRHCGTGGCPIEVWRAERGHYRRALAMQVLAYRIDPDGTIAVSLPRGFCSETSGAQCSYRFAWTAAAATSGWFLPVPPSREVPGYFGPLVQALAEAPRAIPPLAAQEAAYAAWCRQNGGMPETRDAAVLLPDLTGDGLPEALFDARRAMCSAAQPKGGEQQLPCTDPGPCLSVIYTSAPSGWQAGLPRKPFDYGIKWIGERPRMAIADPDCGMCEIRDLEFGT